MKVACVTTHDIHDSSGWSKHRQGIYGASRKITQVLESSGFQIEYLGPLRKPKSPITRSKWLFYRHIFKQDYYSWADSIVLNSYGNQVNKKLHSSNADVILCPESYVPIAQIKSEVPLVIWIDTTLGSLINFYSFLCNLCTETKRNIFFFERAALERCDLIIVTSDWAARFIINTYRISPDKIKVIPRGSNKERTLSAQQVHQAIKHRKQDCCTLTFVGVDWARKGGDIAVAVAARLNQRGLPTQLQIIGCNPDTGDSGKYINFLGFLDRSNPEDMALFESALLQSHFLILPARAEHCAIALSEANSYGVPCLTTDVGGIPTIVQGGRNGRTFSEDDTIDDYCDYVMQYISDPSAYQELATSSLQEFETRLSWNVTQEKARKLIQSVVR